MSDLDLRNITNNFKDVQLASLAAWKDAATVEPRDRGGPYVVLQTGFDPEDPKFTPDEFILGRSGKWLPLAHFYRLPVPERRAEFVFGTAGEVMALLGSLLPKAQILRPHDREPAEPSAPDDFSAAIDAARKTPPSQAANA
ncbi:MAG: hypothetical protein U1G08_14830 [Verrucomicrobiota bacterium]